MAIAWAARLILMFVSASLAPAQTVRVIRFSESIPFHMGEVTSRRIVHPDLGARKTTLNYSVSQPGAEFAQHVHDSSDDTILVLQGELDLRQGESRRRFRAGECAFVPAGHLASRFQARNNRVFSHIQDLSQSVTHPNFRIPRFMFRGF